MAAYIASQPISKPVNSLKVMQLKHKDSQSQSANKALSYSQSINNFLALLRPFICNKVFPWRGAPNYSIGIDFCSSKLKILNALVYLLTARYDFLIFWNIFGKL